MGETHVGACNYKASRLEGHAGGRARGRGRGRHGRGRGRGRKRTEDGPASANAINFAEKCAGGTDGECKKVS